jgi:hypothetical protein
MPDIPVARVVLTGLAVAPLLAGCGSSSSPAASHPVPADSVCTRVADVLSNGPDPGADPVGYAEAQIRLLGAVHATNPALARAISRLDADFRAEYTHGATPAARHAVATGRKDIDRYCPGAAS